MKVAVLSKEGKEVAKVELPTQFNEAIRPDIIKRAVEVSEANKRQPYGAKEDAGVYASSKISRRRHNYKGSYGHGISRVPRKILSRSGTHFNWTGATAPGTVGGRRAHAPKPSKDWSKSINKKENQLAIRSALAATMNIEVVKEHGYRAPEGYPFILESNFESLAKTKEIVDALTKCNLSEELERSSIKKVRAGKGTMRGRRYRKKKGVLLVVSKACALTKSAASVPGVEVRRVEDLAAIDLAPGKEAGRLTLFTKDAIDRIANEKLFTPNRVVVKAEKKTTKETSKSSVKPAPKAAPKKETGKTPVEKSAPAKKAAASAQ